MKIWLLSPDKTACGHYRAILPHRHCKDSLSREGITLECSASLDFDNDYDVYIFHRLLNPQFFPYLLELKNRGKKIVWELDDDLFNIPDWSPAAGIIGKPLLECMRLCWAWSDEVIVSTEPLKEALGYQDKTVVLPNLIDLTDWPRTRYTPPDKTTRILWAGSDTHQGDLEEVVPALTRLTKTHDVQLIFAGLVPEALRSLPQTTFLPMVPLDCYVDLMQLVKPHIALCPLADHKFNDSKSAIKWYEMTLAGAAVVASGGSPYGREMADGRHGYLCYTQEEWYPRITNLIENESTRHALWLESLKQYKKNTLGRAKINNYG